MPEDAFRNEADFPRWPNRAPELGVDRVLTSGQRASVTESLDLLAELAAHRVPPLDFRCAQGGTSADEQGRQGGKRCAMQFHCLNSPSIG